MRHSVDGTPPKISRVPASSEPGDLVPRSIPPQCMGVTRHAMRNSSVPAGTKVMICSLGGRLPPPPNSTLPPLPGGSA